METAFQQVKALLDQMRKRARDPVIEQVSDKIEVLCRSYMLPLPAHAGDDLGLTPQEGRLFGLLKSKEGQLVRRDSILDALYFDKSKEAEPKIVDVLLCRVRRKLSKAGWRIESIHGTGVRMVRETEPFHPRAFTKTIGNQFRHGKSLKETRNVKTDKQAA